MIRLLAIVLLAGCAAAPVADPSGPPNQQQAEQELERMAQAPKPVARPVVILSGFRSPALVARSLADDIIDGTSGRAADVLLIAYPTAGDIDDAAREVVKRINERWPSPSAGATIDVDVIGISMGGLVARWAAMTPAQRAAARAPDPGATEATYFPVLSIARLYTFATPHRGARMAGIGLSAAARDMLPDSAFLKALDAHPAAYPMICYAHLDDRMVGATRAAPPGVNPIWTSGTLFLSHYNTHRNPLMVADLIRRLRDEPPLLEPAGPPPRD